MAADNAMYGLAALDPEVREAHVQAQAHLAPMLGAPDHLPTPANFQHPVGSPSTSFPFELSSEIAAFL